MALVAMAVLLPPPADARDAREAVATVVSEITRADYEGDRAALWRGYERLRALTLPATDTFVHARARYWQAFALWRRAFNGLNVSADRAEIEADLEQAVALFDEASAIDSAFTDAKAGSLSCLGNLAFVRQARGIDVRSSAGRIQALMSETLREAPDNPRVLWVVAAQQRYLPRELGGGADVSLRTLEKGLTVARLHKPRGNPLEPDWGEAELLMGLALAHLGATPPNLAQAYADAREALVLVPHWRAVKDGLLPRIEAAQGAADRAQIDELRRADVQATQAFDVAALADLWTEDIVSLSPGREPVLGRRANIQALERMRQEFGNAVAVDYSQDWRELTIEGNHAFEWGIFTSTVRPGPTEAPVTVRHKAMRVLRREHGRWRIARTIWNEAMTPAPGHGAAGAGSSR